MGDSVENIINSYSSGGILNFEYKEIFDTLASGISCMGMFTHYGAVIGSATTVYYLVKVVVNELKED
ncbi:hypothetical protein CAPN010_15660 [Capnocytophaga cynodegmi]|uniref:hypothetical protein n=1 Tax=Capnocytophaga cynodegmi TaxID=28189 RepID=UPI001EE36113|nr:hypothetical protein [Capnocytophaga cynodegmi]GJQ07408.1 hypothetical protein CAPN010_15660 [Capnocytophaga cynodegmi]